MDCPTSLKRKLGNKWWRLNNLYWIIDESGRRVKFRPNWAQEQLYDNLWYWNLILKARQLGFTTFIDIFILDDCLFIPNLEAGIVAHTKDDAIKIFRRKIKFPYENLPDWLRDQRPLLSANMSEFQFGNGSVVGVGVSARSGTLQRLHVSEFGKIAARYPEKAEEIVSGSLEALHPGSMLWIESTAEGKAGRFFEYTEHARRMNDEGRDLTRLDMRFHFFPWWRHPGRILAPDETERTVIDKEHREYFTRLEEDHGITLSAGQKAWYVKKAATLTDKMKREHPSTPDEAFEASVEGAYYRKQMAWLRQNGRITSVPWEPGIPVNTFWDLGMHDEMHICFHQRVGKENRFINHIKNSGEGLEFYCAELKRLGYLYGTHYFPHDMSVNELGTGTSRLKTFQGLMPGEKTQVVERITHMADGVHAVRNILPTCWLDAANCADLIDCLDNYKREWDPVNGCWKDKPKHDWASHGEASFRQFATGYAPSGASAWRPRRTARQIGRRRR